MRFLYGVLFLVFSASAANTLEMRLTGQMKGWQRRLGLEDWDLRLQVVRESQLDRNAWGAAEWDDIRKTGVIRVLDPRDYNLKGFEMKLDMECTIVHELVHIQVAPLDARDADVREEVVNRLMTALLNRQCPN